MVIRPQGPRHLLQILKPPSVNASAWPTASQQDFLDDGSGALTCVLAQEGRALRVLGTRWPEALLVLQSHSSLAGQMLDKADLKPHGRVWLAARGWVRWEGSGSSFAPGLPGEGAEELLAGAPGVEGRPRPGHHACQAPTGRASSRLAPPSVQLTCWPRARVGPEPLSPPPWSFTGLRLPSLGGLEDLPRDLAASEHTLAESCLVRAGLVTRATGAGL